MGKISRKEQKENTRAAVLAQAETLFGQSGISATTTSDIARALGISHGTLFVHFPTRDDLVRAVVEEFGARLSAQLGERCAEGLALRDLLKAHVAVLAAFEDFYQRLVCEAASLTPHIRSVFYSINASLSYRFYRAAKSGMEDGTIKKMSQVLFFNTWNSLLHYYILNRDLFSETTPILNKVGDELIRHFLNLIDTKQRREK